MMMMMKYHSSYKFPQFTSTSTWYDGQKEHHYTQYNYCMNNFNLLALRCTCTKNQVISPKAGIKRCPSAKTQGFYKVVGCSTFVPMLAQEIITLNRFYCITNQRLNNILTLILLMWRIWWAPNNASRWQMGFNSAFEGLIYLNIFMELWF